MTNNQSEEKLDEIQFDESSVQEEKIEFQPSKRKIYTDKSDPTIFDLYTRFKDGDLILQPDFQRQFVWDKRKSSRLIESLLLEIPLPVIYLAEDNNGKESVIDGQQRLTAFFSFIDGKFPDGVDFKLRKLQVFNELNKFLFKDLEKQIQNKIKKSSIRTITFKRDSDKDLRFEIFERLNTGSVPLNDQELRNCVYRGPYINLLKELSRNTDFMHLLGISNPDKRMKDVELALRFASFYHSTYLNYKSPMRKFFNDEMEKYQFITKKEAEELKNAFKNSVQIIRSLLDKNAFKRFYRGDSDDNRNGYWEPKKFNASLYDILMYSFAREDKNKVFQNLDSIREALIYLMTEDQEFIDSILLSTSSVQAVTKRFDKWRLTLQQIIGIQQKEPRCFSRKLKEDLFKNDPTCAICNSRISDIDDSAIDHIEQYWLGGKTIPENARLVHRYCNWSRKRKE
jgi:uncharacterized protein with ParB-like and HNH nuclease domain